MTSKNTKRALVVSVLSVVLCLAMLAGSTFAWFTDTATVSGNTIESGIIDIRLVDPFDETVDMENETLGWLVDGEVTEKVLWEPGCTFISQPVRVMNHSNLSFYMDAVVSGFEGDLELLDVIEYKIVHAYAVLPESMGGLGLSYDQCTGRKYVYGGGEKGDNLMADSYGIDSDWSDELNDYNNDGVIDEDEFGPGVGEPKPLYDLCLIARMKEEAGNKYQGLALSGASISFIARQSPYEKDSYDQNYDLDAEFPAVS